MQHPPQLDWSVYAFAFFAAYLVLCVFMHTKTWQQQQIEKKIRDQLGLKDKK